MNNSKVVLSQSCMLLLTCLDFNPTVSDLDVLSWSWGCYAVFCVFCVFLIFQVLFIIKHLWFVFHVLFQIFCFLILFLISIILHFDCCTILHDRLKVLACISGSALDWFSSYLSRRTFSVRASKFFSYTTCLTCGVPQGLILDPLLFSF